MACAEHSLAWEQIPSDTYRVNKTHCFPFTFLQSWKLIWLKETVLETQPTQHNQPTQHGVPGVAAKAAVSFCGCWAQQRLPTTATHGTGHISLFFPQQKACVTTDRCGKQVGQSVTSCALCVCSSCVSECRSTAPCRACTLSLRWRSTWLAGCSPSTWGSSSTGRL